MREKGEEMVSLRRSGRRLSGLLSLLRRLLGLLLLAGSSLLWRGLLAGSLGGGLGNATRLGLGQVVLLLLSGGLYSVRRD